jgi:hypothetical protein
MSSITDKDFFTWLHNRLKIKYREDEEILAKLLEVVNNKRIIDKRIDSNFIHKICEKNYPGFHFDYCSETKIGYTPDEKTAIKNLVTSIILDTLSEE